MSDIEKGQYWYVKLPNQFNVRHVCIEDVSDLTVLFQFHDMYPNDLLERYITSEVLFVEAC